MNICEHGMQEIVEHLSCCYFSRLAGFPSLLRTDARLVSDAFHDASPV
jgi:hypothetical protein